ncbi:hypothetical protein P0082_01735 [Candidatus Haliotispira prima]|uniref:Secreted protein n=1 Tax=Candidatus Haliotispira prima TaxID=3034016 RepID=A0ABY8MHX2_9SPIO|nr:hypothetical protein P0082_01735 [Candidatus Haliotispira prima]
MAFALRCCVAGAKAVGMFASFAQRFVKCYFVAAVPMFGLLKCRRVYVPVVEASAQPSVSFQCCGTDYFYGLVRGRHGELL